MAVDAVSSMLAGVTNNVSQQADYPPATKHFLLIGFLGMFIGSIVFCFLSFKKKENKMQETIIFLAAAISAGCYYCMWSGFGVNKKLDSAGNTRMVFFGHFVDRIFSMPLILYSLCMVANAEMGEIVLLLGLDLLMVGCTAIGATQLHPWKWIWWTFGVVILIVLSIQLWMVYTKAKEANSPSASGILILTLITIATAFVYPTVWVLGEEGLAAFDINVETGVIVMADLMAKVVFGLYLLFAVLGAEEEDAEGAEKTSLV
jgi:bacteriorhodopsin